MVESSAAFAERHLQVYGSRSSAAQVLGAAPQPQAEAQVIEALDRNLQNAVGLSTAGADRQLRRWGAAFPQPPGLQHQAHQREGQGSPANGSRRPLPLVLAPHPRPFRFRHAGA